MANIKKFKKAEVFNLLTHNERKDDSHSHSNEDIDVTKSYLNYDLCTKEGTAYERFKKRLSEVKCLNRDDVNVIDSLVVHLPKDVREGDESKFFEGVYAFACQDYGEENITNANVHRDETREHIHLGFIPIIETKNKKTNQIESRVCHDKKITRAYYQTLHTRLMDYMKNYLGYSVEILNGATVGGNKTIQQLKAETLKNKNEELEKHIEKLQEKKTTSEKEVQSLEEKSRDLKKEVEENQSEVEELQEKKTTSEKEVQSLEEKSRDLKKEVAEFKKKKEENQSEVEELQEKKTTTEKELNDLKKQVQKFKKMQKSNIDNLISAIPKLELEPYPQKPEPPQKPEFKNCYADRKEEREDKKIWKQYDKDLETYNNKILPKWKQDCDAVDERNAEKKSDWESKYMTTENIKKAKNQVSMELSQVRTAKEQTQEQLKKAEKEKQKAEQEKKQAEEERKQQAESYQRAVQQGVQQEIERIFNGTPTSRQERLEQFCDSIKFEDGSSVLEQFEQLEEELRQLIEYAD